MSPTAVLLVNLGTPRSPAVGDVRRYLAEFLSDPLVLDMNPIGRWLLLHGIILRTRPRKSAAAYRQVWTDAGSPLLVESRGLVEQVDAELGHEYRVALAMRYGEPAIAPVLADLLDDQPDLLIVVPLYPQYATAATGSSLARVFEALAEIGASGARPEVRTVPAFYDDPDWLASWAAVAGDDLKRFSPDHVLFSYHGLPERQIRAVASSDDHCFASTSCCDAVGPANSSCYRAQCFANTRGLVESLALESTPVSTSFQSRLGSGWIQPFTDEVLPQLASRGVKRLAVLCPAFVADCLETLEEIDIRLRDQWLELGGSELFRVPCPNAHSRFAQAVAGWVRTQAERTP